MTKFTPEFINEQREIIADVSMKRSDFIAAAERGWSAALDEIERLRAEVERLSENKYIDDMERQAMNAIQKENYELHEILTQSLVGGNEDEITKQNLALRAEINRLRAELEKHRWIPVTERLPELVCGNHDASHCLDVVWEYIDCPGAKPCIGEGQYYTKNGWFSHRANSWYASLGKRVTHWREIDDELPEVEK